MLGGRFEGTGGGLAQRIDEKKGVVSRVCFVLARFFSFVPFPVTSGSR